MFYFSKNYSKKRKNFWKENFLEFFKIFLKSIFLQIVFLGLFYLKSNFKKKRYENTSEIIILFSNIVEKIVYK